jgi:hypothetical protein
MMGLSKRLSWELGRGPENEMQNSGFCGIRTRTYDASTGKFVAYLLAHQYETVGLNL